MGLQGAQAEGAPLHSPRIQLAYPTGDQDVDLASPSARTLKTPIEQGETEDKIRMLAGALACDTDYVAAVYLSEHSRLCALARLQDFVPLFAERFTRDRILKARLLQR